MGLLPCPLCAAQAAAFSRAQERYPPMADKTAARTRAETHFSASEARDALVKTELAKERIAFDDRTVKLKALRLARDQAEAAKLRRRRWRRPRQPRRRSSRGRKSRRPPRNSVNYPARRGRFFATAKDPRFPSPHYCLYHPMRVLSRPSWIRPVPDEAHLRILPALCCAPGRDSYLPSLRQTCSPSAPAFRVGGHSRRN